MQILIICGSLRRGSYNRMLGELAMREAPEGMRFEWAEIGDLPLFSEDLEANPPGSVERLRSHIGKSDAVLFVSPEYNYSVPGVLKNAIDWASRPYGKGALQGKTVGVMGASTGIGGTIRMQGHIRQSFQFLSAHCMPMPEVVVTFAATKFDEQGELTDEATRGYVRAYMEAFENWVRAHVPTAARGAKLL
jgi:chromate reductase